MFPIHIVIYIEWCEEWFHGSGGENMHEKFLKAAIKPVNSAVDLQSVVVLTSSLREVYDLWPKRVGQ